MCESRSKTFQTFPHCQRPCWSDVTGVSAPPPIKAVRQRNEKNLFTANVLACVCVCARVCEPTVSALIKSVCDFETRRDESLLNPSFSRRLTAELKTLLNPLQRFLFSHQTQTTAMNFKYNIIVAINCFYLFFY